MADSLTLHVGTRKGLFTFKRGPAGWAAASQAFLGDPVVIVLPDERDGSLYAALNLGHFGPKLHRSDDGGRNWTEISPPNYPPKPDDVPDVVDSMRNTIIPWRLKMIWSMEHAGADQPGCLWAGTVPGGLFRSEDRGQTWELNRPLWDRPERKMWIGGGLDEPGIHSIAVNPKDSSQLTLGVSCGGVWMTRDNGKTWANKGMGLRAEYMPPDMAFDVDVQDPHRLCQCPASPQSLWIQHHNGIFRSTDGAESWTEIKTAKPSSFGFAVVVHPTRPDTAYFVPATKDEKRYPPDGRFVVSRTKDGGRTFEVLTEGLPTGPAYDLVFRHGMDIDRTGRFVGLGSTTGSLWVWDDQAGRFECLSNHLPPIYAVRFG